MKAEDAKRISEESRKRIQKDVLKQSKYLYEVFLREIENAAKLGKNEAILIKHGDRGSNFPNLIWKKGVPDFVSEKERLALSSLESDGFTIYHFYSASRGYEYKEETVFGPVSPIRVPNFTGIKEYKIIKAVW